jgi:hypothetical protein
MLYKSSRSTLLLLSLFLATVSIAENYPSANLSFREKDSISVKRTINQDYKIHAKRIQNGIKLDGTVDETDWLHAEPAKDFYMVLPYDTGHCAAKSEIKVVYDDKAFYLAVIFHDTLPGKRPVESLRRDFTFANNDNFLVFVDPFNDQTTGYSFGVNAAGAMWDGTMSGGAASNMVWDCKWEVRTKNYPDKWTAEMRIPFKSIRYKSDLNHWNIQFSRLDLKLNEKSAWAPVPRQFPTASLAYAGQLIWETPPPASGIKLSVIPYLFGSVSRNFEKSESSLYRKDFGFDAKIGLSTALNLDLTYNPDFSQAEVDDQVTNLERFELYFPEKRQFFLENSDLFGNFGTSNIRPFFSRRIGLDAPVNGGVRLSGRLGQDWRIGMMDMQTGSEGDYLSRNFFVTTIQKKIFSRSNIGAIFVNKQQLNIPAAWDGKEYNRVAGLEYNLASRDNFWNAKLFAQKSFSPKTSSSEEFAQGLNIIYSRKSYLLELSQMYVGRDFNAETGYVPRNDYFRINPKITTKFYPASGTIENHGLQIQADNFYFPGSMKLTDRKLGLDYVFNFKNRVMLEFKSNLWYVLLRQNFDPTNKGTHFMPAGSSYRWGDASILFNSDNRKVFKYDFQAGYGGYFNGNRWFAQGSLNFRYQPYGYISLIYSYNELLLPAPWTRTGFWLIGPKLDLTFTDKLFFTTYVQYNKQAENVNINARLQWRYKPVSDIFLVYSDNYFPESWNVKNRAVVLKMTYWFN